MTITATLEMSNDGLFSVYSETKLGNSFLGGFGNSSQEAKDDFITSISEAIEECEADGIAHPLPNDIEVHFIYDLSAFLGEFDWLNLSKLANYLGVSSSQLRYYKKKGAYASKAQRLKIENGLHALASRLSNVMLV